MKISSYGNNILLEEVYSGVMLKTKEGLYLGICMRDSGYELAVWKGTKQKTPTREYVISPEGLTFATSPSERVYSKISELLLHMRHVHNHEDAQQQEPIIRTGVEEGRLKYKFVYYISDDGKYVISGNKCSFWEKFNDFDSMICSLASYADDGTTHHDII
jgi:hypothetical protein